MQKAPFVFPIIGGRKVEHLLANLEALDISLSDEQIKYLESIIPFDVGFPSSLIVSGNDKPSDNIREIKYFFTTREMGPSTPS